MKHNFFQNLSDEEYEILANKGTEAPFSGEYNDNKEIGKYLCVHCNAVLFSSEKKYNSGTGWPSFYDVENKNSVIEIEDNSYGMKRIEVKCSACKSHLGHVFPDGPNPTGLRYCINSVSLKFTDKA